MNYIYVWNRLGKSYKNNSLSGNRLLFYSIAWPFTFIGQDKSKYLIYKKQNF